MLDIDNFRIFNAAWGHPHGDSLLQHVSKIITPLVKRPGDLAARLGGEEFGILMPDTDADGAMKIA
jgi:diguanylate cyclase (GGDEF)-like protein